MTVAIKGNMRDCVGDGSTMHLDYINVKILVMKVYYSSTKLNSKVKLGKGYVGSLCIISYKFHVHLFQNTKFNKIIVIVIIKEKTKQLLTPG